MSKSNKKVSYTKKNTGFVDYIPAVVKHNAHGWSVEYHAFDPSSGKLKRHAIKLNTLRKRYTTTSEFKQHVTRICVQINSKLAGGWTPFGESRNFRMLMPVRMVADNYIKEKVAELRPDTMRSYRSFRKVLTEWVDAQSKDLPIGSFNRLMAVRFMDSLFENGLRGRSWNNRLKQGRAFFGWAVEKCYTNENPFAGIKAKREDKKKRILVPKDLRAKVAAWCAANNPPYYILCRLVFDALIRPHEAWCLKVGDLRLDEGYAWVDENASKTHYPRAATLTTDLIADLERLTEKAMPDMYLFGPGFKPGTKPIRYQNFREEWSRMRKELHLPEEMQLYSLRDSGINEMIKAGINPLSVMQHADHHDLSITTRYANHADPNLMATICAKAPAF